MARNHRESRQPRGSVNGLRRGPADSGARSHTTGLLLRPPGRRTEPAGEYLHAPHRESQVETEAAVVPGSLMKPRLIYIISEKGEEVSSILKGLFSSWQDHCFIAPRR